MTEQRNTDKGLYTVVSNRGNILFGEAFPGDPFCARTAGAHKNRWCMVQVSICFSRPEIKTPFLWAIADGGFFHFRRVALKPKTEGEGGSGARKLPSAGGGAGIERTGRLTNEIKIICVNGNSSK